MSVEGLSVLELDQHRVALGGIEQAEGQLQEQGGLARSQLDGGRDAGSDRVRGATPCHPRTSVPCCRLSVYSRDENSKVKYKLNGLGAGTAGGWCGASGVEVTLEGERLRWVGWWWTDLASCIAPVADCGSLPPRNASCTTSPLHHHRIIQRPWGRETAAGNYTNHDAAQRHYIRRSLAVSLPFI